MALLTVVFGRKLEQVGQFAERAARAEVVGVRLECLCVARIGLQNGVQVDCGLLAVAESVVVQHGELAQKVEFCLRVGRPFELLFAQLGQFRVVTSAGVQLGQVLGRGAARRLKDRHLFVGADGFFDIAKGGLCQLRTLGQDLNLFFVGPRLADAFAQEAVEVRESTRFSQHPFEQRERFGMEGHRGERLAQGGYSVVDVTRFMAPARDLIVEARGAFGTVGPGPVRVGVDRGQSLQGFVVARVKSDHVAQLLRCLRQVADFFRQNSAKAEHDADAALRIRGPCQLDLVQPAHHRVVAESAVDLAGRLDDTKMIAGDFRPESGRRQGVFDARDLLSEGALDFPVHLGDAGGIFRLHQRDGLHLQHLEVFGGAALFSVDILQASDGLAVGGIAIDRMGQVSFCAGHVGKVVDTDFGR